MTLEDLKLTEAGKLFACGELPNSEEGLFMTNVHPGRMLRWVAKKGFGYNDWAIYCQWDDKSFVYIGEHGDKVTTKSNILKCVQCDEAMLNTYRY